MSRRKRIPTYRCFLTDRWRGPTKAFNRTINGMGLSGQPVVDVSVTYSPKYSAWVFASDKVLALTDEATRDECIAALAGALKSAAT